LAKAPFKDASLGKEVTMSEIDFATFWSKEYELRIYYETGEFRSILPTSMDLVDFTMGLWRSNKFIFDFKSKYPSKIEWSEKDLSDIEGHLRNDFREDGYRLRFKRIVGLGQRRSDAALWRITAY